MAYVNLDEICGSSFWDWNVTWYTEHPSFTECFQKTALVWIPCAFLWMFLPFETYCILNSKFRNIPWNWLNITKIALTLFLILLSVSDVAYVIYKEAQGFEVYPVDFGTPIVKIATFGLSLGLTAVSRLRGRTSSGGQFVFWLLLVLCGVPELARWIAGGAQDQFEAERVYENVSFVVYYFASLALFIFNCFADQRPLVSEYPPCENPFPEDAASFLSKMLFLWLDPLMWKGFRTPLTTKDLWTISPENSSRYVVPKFDKQWEKVVRSAGRPTPTNKASFSKLGNSIDFVESRPRNKRLASVLPAIFRTYWSIYLLAAALKIVASALMFVSPQILRLLIQFVEVENYLWKGCLYAVLLLLSTTLETFFLTHHFQKMYVIGLRIRTALISLIYRKALRLSSSARRDSTVGEIVNLMSVDAQRFVDVCLYISALWASPIEIAVALYFLWGTLGPSSLAGLAVMILFMPLNMVIANYVKNVQVKQMKSKDERVRLVSEMLNGIKVLKLYAWEPSFRQRVTRIRDKETRVLKQAVYLNSATAFVWTCTPFIVSLASFGTFVMLSDANVLDAQTAFVSLSLFNIIRMPLAMMPMLIISFTQVVVSIKRMNKFLNMEDLDPASVSHDLTQEHPLVVRDGTFSWGSGEPPVLRNVELEVPEGSLVAVVGTVGSGKSSLIAAFLGEMDRLSGYVNTKGSIAYVPQQAWIRNATLKDNVLFGKPLVSGRYSRVIEACALKSDLEILPGGDQIEIGEKGINLSGGQKQRVSLARAVYNDADIYFLDDPLSAVDSHVGKHIFDRVIGPSGMLKKKTRLLVTHSVNYLPEVDLIVVLKDGQVTEKGTYQELLDRKGAFSEFMLQYQQETEPDDPDIVPDGVVFPGNLESKLSGSLPHTWETASMDSRRSRNTSLSRQISHDTLESNSIKQLGSGSLKGLMLDAEESANTGERLIEEEKAETGNVKWSVYSHYMRTMGPLLCVLTIVFNVLFQGLLVGSNLWLSAWTNEYGGGPMPPGTRDLYLGVYGLMGVGQVVTTFVCDLCPRLGCWVAARVMHSVTLEGILHAPLTFFDVTPLGRIVSRFSKDVDILDSSLPQQLSDLIFCMFEVVATLFVISYSTPLFMSMIVPLAIIYIFIQRFFVASSRQLKRLESISRSPIFSHFGESITGASTIRAYSLQQKFEKESEETVDTNQMCYYPGMIANRWLAIRLETLGNLIIFAASLFAVLGRESVDPGLVGLSISYSLQVTGTLNWLVRMATDVETNIVAVERLKEYADCKQEAPWENASEKVSQDWPSEGSVQFQDYKVRYREGLDLVLKGITFSIRGGEKVGIVGRTGAGKSSLTMALFRIIEAAGGRILIDGCDVATLGLHTLRSRLTIIPQDPVLFSGSLRQNLDPFDSVPEDALWRALELAHLKAFVKGLPAGLAHEVVEGGENLSVGQRQLVCLVRALLRKTKVLVMDEATAAVDLETDDLIQRTIRDQFHSCTILTIAHRLNTIMDYDRVIVLDKGEVKEFDRPEVLLQDHESIFFGMAQDAGLA
ncbi:LOW QUALITY PROTEIN: multidrug resistance-associated protein 1-like [Bacillus rossius redtenbacheri]|uniref:LOW QUALITY PROTEIN: multidrug resistance-associated protein 1-like n=1 Tax=Bacillus rossius redtenbacheri TaxID=93214 RepID=UPI002FDDB339